VPACLVILIQTWKCYCRLPTTRLQQRPLRSMEAEGISPDERQAGQILVPAPLVFLLVPLDALTQIRWQVH